MQKIVYHSPKVRSVAVAKKDFTGRPIISIWLEVKKWYGWLKCGWAWEIDIELRADQKPMAMSHGRCFIHLNPMVLDYKMGGKREIWDESTFDLDKRLEEEGEKALRAIAHREQTMCKLKQMVSNG